MQRFRQLVDGITGRHFDLCLVVHLACAAQINGQAALASELGAVQAETLVTKYARTHHKQWPRALRVVLCLHVVAQDEWLG